jgi:hypothetical protein
MASIASVRSIPKTSREFLANASAMYLGPVAISRTRSVPLSRAAETKRAMRCSSVTHGLAAKAVACVVKDSANDFVMRGRGHASVYQQQTKKCPSALRNPSLSSR